MFPPSSVCTFSIIHQEEQYAYGVCTRHCLKSITQVVCFLWKRMDFPFCTNCFNSYRPGMVSAWAQGRDLTYRNEEFSLRKRIILTLTMPMWWTSVFLQTLPWQSNFWWQSPLGSKSSNPFHWQTPATLPTSCCPHCCNSRGGFLLQGSSTPASDELWWLRQEIPSNQSSSAIMEMSLIPWSCAPIRV